MPVKQLEATIELIKYMRSEVKRIYGTDIPIDSEHIVGHCHVTPKWKPNCPGQRFPFDEILKRLNEKNGFKVDEENLTAMVNAGVISSPDYWRKQSVQYLNDLLRNAKGKVHKGIDNGITELPIAFDILVSAGIIISQDYWQRLIKGKTVQHLDSLILNIANKCRIVLEKIIMAEAGGESEKGQILVGNVVMNRCKDKSFPNGIYNVVFQEKQFEPKMNGAYAKAVPTQAVKIAVDKILAGTDFSQGATYFCSLASASIPGNWHEQKLTKLFDCGNHRFYK